MSQQRRDELVSYMSVMTKRVSSREVMFQLNEFLIDSLIPRHSRETGQRANQLFEQMTAWNVMFGLRFRLSKSACCLESAERESPHDMGSGKPGK